MWRRLFLSASLGAAAFQMLPGAVHPQANLAKATSPEAPAAVSGQRGDALYHGKEPLTGRIRGHDDDLPPEAVRCANCHDAAPATSASARRLSRFSPPRLDSALLLEFHQRRGGPPSRYDEPAFCKLLQTGIDPMHILIAREMPAYNIDDAQCASLWSFLLSRPPAAKDSAAENSADKPKESPAEAPGTKP